ncbi:MAG: hypothetical protein KF805_08290 [Phycisphaeraceae bacterium]|nr:hypothetical protein [Phycisphaeraceae bacterium]
MEEQRKNIQIREGAGLEEARLNQDFIDFVTKWSTPLLLLLALGVGGNYLYQQYTKRQSDRLALAFEQLAAAAAVANPSPESLRQVALDFEGVGSVAELARLKAADAYMRSVMRGVKPGAEVNADGTVKGVGDELTAADRESFLNLAAEQYQLVADATKGVANKESLYIGALFGLASVEESRGNAEGAKKFYEQIRSAATGVPGFAEFASIAADRIESLPRVLAVGKLPTKATLPPETKEDEKPAMPLNIPTDLPSGPSLLGPVGPAAPSQPAPAPSDGKPDAPATEPVPENAPAPAPK